MENPQLEPNDLDVGAPWDEVDCDCADEDARADDYLERSLRSGERKAFHYVKLVLIYAIPLLALVVAVVFVLNYILPTQFRWLSDDELSALQSFVISILSGVGTSLAVNYFYHSK